MKPRRTKAPAKAPTVYTCVTGCTIQMGPKEITLPLTSAAVIALAQALAENARAITAITHAVGKSQVTIDGGVGIQIDAQPPTGA